MEEIRGSGRRPSLREFGEMGPLFRVQVGDGARVWTEFRAEGGCMSHIQRDRPPAHLR